MLIEVKHLEERIERGVSFIREPPRVRSPPSNNWSSYALTVTRHFNEDNKFSHRTLQINSPHIKSVLKEVIGDYPGQSYNTENISLVLPAWSLFHYLDDLKKLTVLGGDGSGGVKLCRDDGLSGMSDMKEDGNESEDSVAGRRDHLKCMVSWLDDEFKDILSNYKNLVCEGLITYPL